MLTKRERLRKAVKSIKNLTSDFGGESRPVFLLGEMRSGTNMLTECFDRTPGTTIYNENDDAAFRAYELREMPVIAGLVAEARSSHTVFKCIADSGRAREILDAFQGSKAIWIYRRYQDVVNSALRRFPNHREHLRWLLEDPIRAGWRVHGMTEDHMGLVRQYYSDALTEASARALIWYLRNDTYFTQSLESDERVLLVKYENLVCDPESELHRIFEFLGLSKKHSVIFRQVP
jgi:hypothetical protein